MQQVVVLDDRPTSGRQPRAELRRIAAALGGAPGVAARLEPWSAVRFRDGALTVGAAGRPDAVLAFPASGGGPVPASPAEVEALEHLKRSGVVGSLVARIAVLNRLLSRAPRLGVATNTPGRDGRWGRKDHLELLLRAHARRSGRRVRRPETVVAHARQVPLLLDLRARRGLTTVLKPANASRGEGIRFVSAGDPHPPLPDEGCFVLQDPVAPPWMLGGTKADVRCYLALDTSRHRPPRRIGPILVRKAAVPYESGDSTAERTNSSLRRRLGLPADIRPLDRLPGVSSAERAAVRAEVEEVIGELAAAWEGWRSVRRSPTSRRLLLWGVDIGFTTAAGRIAGRLLEVNVHPQLLRGAPEADGAVIEMLRDIWLPMVLERAGDAEVGRPPALAARLRGA